MMDWVLRVFSRALGIETPVDLDADDVYADCPFPHCDSNVLHAPGECEHCDHYPELQRARLQGNVNFTGEFDERLVPDPATLVRPLATINKWPGNVAR